MNKSVELRVLIIDANPGKLKKTQEILALAVKKMNSLKWNVETATNYIAAYEKIENSFFDFILMGLSIPLHDDDEDQSNFENGQRLAFRIMKRVSNRPFLLLGITTFRPDEYSLIYKDNNLLKIIDYDKKGDWIKEILEDASSIIGTKEAFRNHFANSYNFDVLILTARKENEYTPIFEQIKWSADPDFNLHVPNLRCAFGNANLGNKNMRVGIVCLDEMGLSHSASVATRLISLFRPKYFAMLGMCCGFDNNVFDNGLSLGDIVIATETNCWDEGKYQVKKNSDIDEDTNINNSQKPESSNRINSSPTGSNSTELNIYNSYRSTEESPYDADNNIYETKEFINRAATKYIDAGWLNEIKRILDEKEQNLRSELAAYYESQELELIEEELRKSNLELNMNPRIMSGLMVSGTCVVNSSTILDTVRERFSRAIGLEMEAHSIYTTQNYMDGAKPKTLVIKGVADFGNGTKTKTIQKLASVASFMTFECILTHI